MRRRFLIFILCIAALLSACRESPQTMMKKQLDLGQKYLADKNYEEALISFQLVLDLDPKVIEAYEGIAEIYSASGKDRDAARVLEQGIEAVILGCTELPLLLNNNNCPVDCLDSVEIHIRKLIDMAMIDRR